MISIIIPHHLEDKEKIKPLMISMDQQIGIDFNSIEIILCCDLEQSPLDDYNFEEYTNISSRIKKIKSPYKQNPGMSRQTALDICLGEYVLFCDADDSLYNMGVLRELLENIEHSHADVYRFKFLEEIGSKNSASRSYNIKVHNWTWVFAQAYRVSFLRENNVRFSPSLRWHEDTYFNLILRYCNPDVVDINSIAYLWRYSDNSITRIDDHSYTFLSLDEFLEATSQGFRVVQNVYNKNCLPDILTVSVRAYLALNNDSFLNRFGKEDIERVERRYYEYVKEFLPTAFFPFLPQELDKMFTQIFFKVGQFIPKIGWHDYLLKIESKYIDFVGDNYKTTTQ